MDRGRLAKIRDNERISHTAIYEKYNLYEEGSWLSKPIKTVMDIVPMFSEYKRISILDLGCGVGRNAIYIANVFKNVSCVIDCVDILPLAIDKLEDNAKKYNVMSAINGIVESIEEYVIEKEKYDFIVAISTLEHVDTAKTFKKKVMDIEQGTKKNGVVCFVINTEVEEENIVSGENMIPQFEVNLSSLEVLLILMENFRGWEILKKTVVEQIYETPRKNCISKMKTNVVTFVAQKGREAI